MANAEPVSASAVATTMARLVLLAGAALLTACATPTHPPAPPPIAVAAPQGPLALAGRFSMTFSQSVPEPKQEAASGRFALQRDARQLSVDLMTPLGQTIARAEQRVGEPARLQTADNQTLTGRTLDDVFQRAIGIRVPAERLPDWLSNRFEKTVSQSADGRRVTATDAGWDIERDDHRWTFVWHQGTQRIEVRLVLDRP